jgi:hypothetical protein
MQLILILVVVPLVLGAAAALIYIFLISRSYLGLATGFLVLLAIMSLVTAVNLTFGMGSGMFGRLLTCLVLPATAASLIVFIAARSRFFRSAGQDKRLRRWYLVGFVLVPFLQFFPFIGELFIGQACDALHRQTGETIVAALEAYRDDFGAYPDDLEDLAPRYIDEIPSPRCFSAFGWFERSDSDQADTLSGTGPKSAVAEGFKLHECDPQKAKIVTVYSVEYDFILRYNLATGNWSRVSFLDGRCSFLR